LYFNSSTSGAIEDTVFNQLAERIGG